jgi:ATP-dependent Clp protease ATP-binding subunit ClpC
VEYSKEALEHAVSLSARFIVDRHLPDKAVALLDLAGSRAARAGDRRVTEEHIGRLVAERAGIPVERVLSSDRERLLNLETELADLVVGHRDSVTRIANVVRRNAAGFGSHRPQGSFLFLGPTGVGKTETAKALATLLHGSVDALVRFDLSEFSEGHSVARLLGAPPGYVGHDAGGQLTELVRKRPACVLLFDEVEKAHREVLQVFLQILDDGRVTDGHGRTVSFAECIVIMTSNVGADLYANRRIGFEKGAAEAHKELEERVLERAKRELAPELWGRIEERLVFHPLAKTEVREVTRRLAEASSRRLLGERGIGYSLDEGAVDFLVEQGGYDTRLGARPMRHVLSRIVEAPIAARILEGRIHADEHVYVSTRTDGTLAFLVGEDRTSLSQRPRQ